jgi:hypothetical protein
VPSSLYSVHARQIDIHYDQKVLSADRLVFDEENGLPIRRFHRQPLGIEGMISA